MAATSVPAVEPLPHLRVQPSVAQRDIPPSDLSELVYRSLAAHSQTLKEKAPGLSIGTALPRDANGSGRVLTEVAVALKPHLGSSPLDGALAGSFLVSSLNFLTLVSLPDLKRAYDQAVLRGNEVEQKAVAFQLGGALFQTLAGANACVRAPVTLAAQAAPHLGALRGASQGLGAVNSLLFMGLSLFGMADGFYQVSHTKSFLAKWKAIAPGSYKDQIAFLEDQIDPKERNISDEISRLNRSDLTGQAYVDRSICINLGLSGIKTTCDQLKNMGFEASLVEGIFKTVSRDETQLLTFGVAIKAQGERLGKITSLKIAVGGETLSLIEKAFSCGLKHRLGSQNPKISHAARIEMQGLSDQINRAAQRTLSIGRFNILAGLIGLTLLSIGYGLLGLSPASALIGAGLSVGLLLFSTAVDFYGWEVAISAKSPVGKWDRFANTLTIALLILSTSVTIGVGSFLGISPIVTYLIVGANTAALGVAFFQRYALHLKELRHRTLETFHKGDRVKMLPKEDRRLLFQIAVKSQDQREFTLSQEINPLLVHALKKTTKALWKAQVHNPSPENLEQAEKMEEVCILAQKQGYELKPKERQLLQNSETFKSYYLYLKARDEQAVSWIEEVKRENQALAKQQQEAYIKEIARLSHVKHKTH